MVKYLITLFILCIVSTMLYKQPACNAANAKITTKTKTIKKTPFSKLGKQVKEARLKQNWTTTDFANAIGISDDDLESIEAGKRTPAKEQLYKIEETLETTFEME